MDKRETRRAINRWSKTIVSDARDFRWGRVWLMTLAAGTPLAFTALVFWLLDVLGLL